MKDVISALIENESYVMNSVELKEWFKNNSDGGVVKKDIILFETNNIRNGEFVMSDFNLNRLGMKVNPNGWDLNNYKINPVLLWNHDDSIPAIGRMVDVRIDNNRLIGKPEFAPKEVDEFAWSIGQKVDMGYLTSGSVGFQVKEIDMLEEKGKEPVLVSKKQELYEFSIVNMPALPSAVKHSAPVETRQDYIETLFVDKKEKQGLELFKKNSQETSGITFFDKTKKEIK